LALGWKSMGNTDIGESARLLTGVITAVALGVGILLQLGLPFVLTLVRRRWPRNYSRAKARLERLRAVAIVLQLLGLAGIVVYATQMQP
jgi:hypothetical protein